MTEYHETAVVTSGTNPYAYQIIPPIGALLDIICDERSVGGCFRPGNRTLARRMGYASASQIPYLLSQLACDGWISYDATSGVIMLLRDPRERETDQAIRSLDRRSDAQITDDDSALIDPIDRDIQHQDTEYESDQSDRSNPQCMEDSCLAAADHDSESAAARYKYHAAPKTISPTDHPAALVMAELGTNATLRAKALTKRPDLTPQQVRDTWAHFEPRIAAGRCDAGAFHAAISRGELHPAPPDPAQPIPVADYADDPGFKLGSDVSPPGDDAPESIGDRAKQLLPPDASGADWVFVQTRLARGDSEAGALQALETRRRAVRR